MAKYEKSPDCAGCALCDDAVAEREEREYIAALVAELSADAS